MEFTSLSVSPAGPVAWFVTPLVAIAYGLSVFFASRAIWSGAFTRTEFVLRSIGSFVILFGLLVPFAMVHGLLVSMAFMLVHGSPFKATLFTGMASWSRLLLALGGILGFLMAPVLHFARPAPSRTPA